MKTFKDITWNKQTGFGVVHFDNGLRMVVTILEGGSRPIQGLIFPSDSDMVKDAEPFDFSTPESLEHFMKLVQKREEVAA